MPLPEPRIVITHSDCVCNEVLALACRHQATVPEPTRPWTDLLVPPGMSEPVEPWSRRRVVEYYGGSKRKEFERAYESLQTDPLVEEDGKVRMFLKMDKYECGAEFKPKAPRCIQFRQKRYGLELGRYVHPLEQELYNSTVDASGTHVFAKCRNSEQRAADLWEKANEFVEPVFVLLDQTNWDAHVNATLLEYEHQTYLRKCPRTELRQLLNWQRQNNGATKNGTKYQTRYTRMSGDMNTALGNCVINYGLLYSWTMEAGVKACFYIDGDDSVVVVDRKDAVKLSELDPAKWFLNFGMEAKVEWATEFEHCEFCQSRPVWDGLGWKMVRNPERFLLRSEWTVQPHQPEFIPRLVSSVGKCELASGIGIPVVQSLSLAMIEASGDHKLWKGLDSYRKAKMERWAPERAQRAVREVTAESRASFEKAWGISAEEQVEMEAAKLSLSATTQDDWAHYLSHFAGDNDRLITEM